MGANRSYYRLKWVNSSLNGLKLDSNGPLGDQNESGWAQMGQLSVEKSVKHGIEIIIRLTASSMYNEQTRPYTRRKPSRVLLGRGSTALK